MNSSLHHGYSFLVTNYSKNSTGACVDDMERALVWGFHISTMHYLQTGQRHAIPTLLKCWPIPDYGAPAYTMISTSCNRQIAVRVFLTRKAVSLAALLLYQHSFIILDTDCSAYKRNTDYYEFYD